MADDNEDLPPGFPGGHVPIRGDIVEGGTVIPRRAGNRVMSGDEMEGAFGPHPWADWKPVIRRGKRKTWMKDGGG